MRQSTRHHARALSNPEFNPFEALSTIEPMKVIVKGTLRSMPPVPMTSA